MVGLESPMHLTGENIFSNHSYKVRLIPNILDIRSFIPERLLNAYTSLTYLSKILKSPRLS